MAPPPPSPPSPHACSSSPAGPCPPIRSRAASPLRSASSRSSRACEHPALSPHKRECSPPPAPHLPSSHSSASASPLRGLYNNSFDGTIPQELANLSPDYCDLGGTNSWLCPLPDPPLDSDCLAGYFTPDLSCTPSADEDSSLGAIVGGVVGAVALVAVVVGGFFAYKKMKKAPAAAPPSTVSQANVAVEMAPSPIPQAR